MNNRKKGKLTARQCAALTECSRLSPGYRLQVECYEETQRTKGSAATHVLVWREGKDTDYVGLVGKRDAQFYDKSRETERVVRRVAARVYRLSGVAFNGGVP